MKDYKDLVKRLRAFSAAAIVKEAADAIDHLNRQLAHKEKIRKSQAETIMVLRAQLKAALTRSGVDG